MAGEGNFVFEHKSDGPGGWAVIGTGTLVGIGLIIVAMALFALATFVGAALVTFVQYLGWMCIALGGGQFVFKACQGGAIIIEARGRARALQIKAQAEARRAKAAEIEAATRHVAMQRGTIAIPADFTMIEDDHAR